MKCFKHLCAKLFLCLFFASTGFVLNVNAEEIGGEAEAAETVTTTDAVDIMALVAAIQQAMSVPAETAVVTETADATMVTTDATTATNTTVATNNVTPVVDIVAAAEARAQDVDYLSRLVQTEGGTFDDRVCVALTALHRVDSPQFPNTVKENIDAPSQFTKPTKGEVLPENRLAAEYAMELWESGLSYSVLPYGYLYFAGNGKRNRFRNAAGDHYDAPDITQFLPYITAQGPDGALILFFDDFLGDVEFLHILTKH